MGFSEWVRGNSERYLLEAAQQEMARRHGLPVGPPLRRGPMAFLWRRVFVPVYRLLPWWLRRTVIRLMPGSHRHRWGERGPPRGVRAA